LSEVRPFYHQEQTLLQGLVTATSLPASLRDRARLILLAAQGLPRWEIAARLGYTPDTVRKWADRFNAEGLLGLFDRPRSGAPRLLTVEAVLDVVQAATTCPADLGLPFASWTLTKLRRYLRQQHQIALSREGLRQVLARHGLSWKKAKSWQNSHDPNFAQLKAGVVELYTDPPEGALVLCIDQKGPVQVRDYPGGGYAPKGKAPRRPSDYVRHGVLYVLGALSPHTGQVWARCFTRYNRLTVIGFLGWLLRQLPEEQEIYIIWDQAGAHTAQDVTQWLQRHYPGRVHLRFTPTKAAWLNLIEGWWTIFSRDVLRGAKLATKAELRAAVRRYVAYYNEEPTAFVWGRQRPKRCFRAGPLRRGRLRGRAPVGNLNGRFLYRLAVGCCNWWTTH
jgi:transposase